MEVVCGFLLVWSLLVWSGHPCPLLLICSCSSLRFYFALRPSPHHRNPAGVHRDSPLNLHLNRRPHIESHIAPALQQSPPNSGRRSRRSANPRSIQSRTQPARQRASRSSVDSALRAFLNLFPRILILLNRPFLIFHRIVLRPRRVLHRPRQHYGISAGRNHRSKVNQDFRPPLQPPTPLHVRNLPLNVGS